MILLTLSMVDLRLILRLDILRDDIKSVLKRRDLFDNISNGLRPCFLLPVFELMGEDEV